MVSDRGPLNPSLQGVSFMCVVFRSFEHHADDSTSCLGSTSILRTSGIHISRGLDEYLECLEVSCCRFYYICRELKLSPVGVVRRGVAAQVSSTSLDHGSKLCGPSPKALV
ncbi:hypothetical protein TNCV_731331 [Trichonephila clavipes]|nr:hypothetical protein TNCV_731331 [Trichonephila clavipes]